METGRQDRAAVPSSKPPQPRIRSNKPKVQKTTGKDSSMSVASSVTTQTMTSTDMSSFSPRSSNGSGRSMLDLYPSRRDDSSNSSVPHQKINANNSQLSSLAERSGPINPPSPGAQRNSTRRRSSMDSCTSRSSDDAPIMPRRSNTSILDTHQFQSDTNDNVPMSPHRLGSTSEHSRDSPLVPPKRGRFEDDHMAQEAKPQSYKSSSRHTATHSLQADQSHHSRQSSFEASYGSLSLGGDSSLSSNDSFHNSPTTMTEAIGRKSHDPIKQMEPAKKILKPTDAPNHLLSPRRRYVSSSEESEEASQGDSSVYSSSESSEPTHLSTSESEPYLDSDDGRPVDGEESYSEVQRRTNYSSDSIDSEPQHQHTNQSFETSSDDGSKSLPSIPPIYNMDDSEVESRVSSASSETINSSLMNTPSQNNNRPNTRKSQMAPASYGGGWATPKAMARPPKTDRGKIYPQPDMSAWSSGDDSSASDDSPMPTSRKKPQDKPRSAYDKNAPWYCGEENEDGIVEDDLDSMNSDTSSVLSNLRQPNNPTTTTRKDSQQPPMSDASISFSDLAKPLSMTLSDLEEPKSTKEQPLQNEEQEASMSLNNLMSPGNDADDEGLPQRSKVSVDSTESDGSEDETDDSDTGTIEDDDESEDEDVQDNEVKEKKKFDTADLLKSRTFWRCLWIGLITFLLLDMVLVVVLLVGKDKGNDSPSSPKVLASVPNTICWDMVPSQGLSKLCSPEDTELGGAVPNLVAKAILSTSTTPADISLIPAGLTEDDIPAGDFTRDTAVQVLSESERRRLRHGRKLSNDDLVTLSATGSQIHLALERTVAEATVGGQPYLYPYASGVRYSVDLTKESNRVIGPVVHADGVPAGSLEPTEDYTVITTGDWATEYFQTTGESTGKSPLDALVQYAENQQTLEAPEFSTRHYVSESSGPSDGGSVEPNEPTFEPTEPQESLTTVTEDICLEWVPGQGESQVCSKEDTASHGGGACNVVAWGLLSEIQLREVDTEIFLLNAMMCQTDILSGPLLEHEARALLPYNHEVVMLTVLGEQLSLALEQAVDYVLESATRTGSYPYAGGLRYKVDATASLGERVTEIESFTRGRWKSISLTREYPVATTSPLAEGEDGYDVLLDAMIRTDPGYEMQSLFIEYLSKTEQLSDLPLEQYSTQGYVPASS